ncbi:MAG: cyclic nucleotide-binding domain-containing protein [Rubrobacter sp.]|nr:cyclic nucleotide-binding domain-containing protein [Rubrobacter sp.]
MTEERLQRVRFFEFLTDEERSEFMDGAQPTVFEAGAVIISEGEESSSLFVLTSGRVEVRKKIPGDRERSLAEIDADREATVVGERGLLGQNEASATVRASSRVEAIRVPREAFRRMISEGRPAAFKLSYRIARTLAQRLTRLDEEVVEAIRDLERRGETDLEAFRDRLITEWTV